MTNQPSKRPSLYFKFFALSFIGFIVTFLILSYLIHLYLGLFVTAVFLWYLSDAAHKLHKESINKHEQ